MKNNFTVCIYSLFVLSFALVQLLSMDVQAQEFKGPDINLTRQYIAEKQNLEENKSKLSSDLLQLIQPELLPPGITLENYAAAMSAMNQIQLDENITINDISLMDAEAYVYIYFETGASQDIPGQFEIRITDTDLNNNITAAWVKLKHLKAIAESEKVKRVTTIVSPVIYTGSVTTEGDGIHKTDQVRSNYAQTGAGIKVGIISNGVNTRASAISSGDLPAEGLGLTVLSNAIGGDEGTAMLEIVHDMAPGAQLYFHDAGTNTIAFNNAISNLVSAGCDVVCDDVGWITEPFFEDGTVASHTASVIAANDIIYVSSAGNAGQSHYQGDYFPKPTGNNHDFSGGTTSYRNLYLNMPAGGNVRIVLQWNDKFGLSGNDYDLILVNQSSTIVASSWNTQDGNDNPLEWFSYTASTAGVYQIIVDKWNGAAKTLEVYVYPGNGTSIYTNNITPVDAIFGHAAVPEVLCVGAVRVTAPTAIELFSSQGPSTISYPSSTVRSKPCVVGADGGLITGAGGFGSWDGANWRFYGTSASAPHVAAVAAQMWGGFTDKTGNEIRDCIRATATDLGGAGFDYIFGNGCADAINSYGALPVELISFNAISSKENTVKLTWQTATEDNNYGFEIERQSGIYQPSSGSRQNSLQVSGESQWEPIGFVKGAGSSNSLKEYYFIDDNFQYNDVPGKHYYRLKQINIDGTFAYSGEIEVCINSVPHEFILMQNYPNPFNPATTIKFALPVQSRVKIEVFNLIGERIAVLADETKEAGYHKVDWDSNGLVSGVYLFSIHAAEEGEPASGSSRKYFQEFKKMLLLK